MSQQKLHPALQTREARRSCLLLVTLRCLLLAAGLIALNFAFPPGSSAMLLIASCWLGVFAATRLAFSKLRLTALLPAAPGLLLLLAAMAFILDRMGPASGAHSLWLYILFQHLSLTLLVFFLSLSASWCFWRFSTWACLELAAIWLGVTYALSGHRNFHFDTPAFLTDIAWTLGLGQLEMLVWTGVLLLLLSAAYLLLASMPTRPLAHFESPRVKASSSGAHPLISLLTISFVALLTALVSREVYRHYDREATSRVANGVGQESQQGLSPLSFHSALGTSNQPAAVVRLEGDYKDNPFSPMLYFRESALSEFNGEELVLAGPEYDSDLSRSAPEQAFSAAPAQQSDNRRTVEQSMYLLSQHQNAFAIDYPTSLLRLKNPEPGRFKNAYRALSAAPSVKLEDLSSPALGDPKWTDKEWKHYTEPHPDTRYSALALSLTLSATTPLEKVRTLAGYLSAKSIYTLSPNHEVEKGQDQTAPYLFGDMRGYCVHFAHAMVYLYRALGVPARIGTGYLTDLKDSRDGHILLRMSDRHAWAEVYFQDYGWMPFDVQPQQVENHADLTMDMKLLEELMGLLGPDAEILPDLPESEKARLDRGTGYQLPSWRETAGTLAVLLTLLALLKIYLLFGWLLPGSRIFRLERALRTRLALLCDLNFTRSTGETREEFRERMLQNTGLDSLTLTSLYNRCRYGKGGDSSISAADMAAAMQGHFRLLSQLSWPKKLLVLANPASIIQFLGGGLK